MSDVQDRKILSIAELESRLAEKFPGYESRPSQTLLAEAIHTALTNRQTLLGQAPPGTGKSFAALMPVIADATTQLHDGTTPRYVYATATKNLQNQLADKDLPWLRANLGVPFTYAVLKGRGNYVCKARMMEAKREEVPNLVQIMTRAEAEDFDGQRESLGFDVSDRAWSALTVSGEDCPGRTNCPLGRSCFAENAKIKAKEADVVVVNHALLAVELMLKSWGVETTMLGDFDGVIIDEAHNMESYVTNVFGMEIREGTFTSLASNIRALCRRVDYDDPELDEAVSRMLTAMTALWDVLVPGRIRARGLLDNGEQWIELVSALKALAGLVRRIPVVENSETRRKVLLAKTSRLASRLHDLVADAASPDADRNVRWVEIQKGWGRNSVDLKILKVAPVDVSAFLRENLFSQVPAVLMSATLAVDGKLGYIAKRLGVDSYREIVVESPFDFPNQAGLYVPADLPAPSGGTRNAWESQSVDEIRELLEASQGRALVLFTSYAQMKTAYEALAGELPYTCMMQGQRPPSLLAEDFRADTHSVLFATRSFFEGIDIQGESLSCLIVDKMPFPRQNDPLVEARCEVIVRNGGSDFFDYSVPEMIITLQQAVGRLIRHREDFGIMVILDSRLTGKSYGRKVLRSLPPARPIQSIAGVYQFFAQREALS